MTHLLEYIGAEGVRTVDVNPFLNKPRPGDPILWSEDDNAEHYACKPDTYGRVWEIGTGFCDPDEIHACCELGSAFWLPSGAVSISGGPFRILNASRLTWSGKFHLVRFWNWGDNSPGAGKGVDYTVSRPVWVIEPETPDAR